MFQKVALSVLIPTKNEERNLPACLEAIMDWADEILIVDSGSTDKTLNIALNADIKTIHFEYKGGWPKKRQWTLNNYSFRNNWILLLDADEILLPEIKKEIEIAIRNENINGYSILLQMEFLGKKLKFAYPGLRKFSLFRKGKARFEKRLENQDNSMADIEIHEHLVIEGKLGEIKSPILHRNFNSLSRYIIKHNEYSNWEAAILQFGNEYELPASIFGNQAQKRRWLKKKLYLLPGISLIYFLFHYFFRLGFLDGKAGFYYCLFQSIQIINVKAKIFESKLSN